MNANQRPKAAQLLLETLLLAALYAALGRVCTMLAHSVLSGNLILFWPPAGLALPWTGTQKGPGWAINYTATLEGDKVVVTAAQTTP